MGILSKHLPWKSGEFNTTGKGNNVLEQTLTHFTFHSMQIVQVAAILESPHTTTEKEKTVVKGAL